MHTHWAISKYILIEHIFIATEGSDFIFGPYDALFPAGVTRAAFNVIIIEDDILESDESFTLVIDLLTLPRRIMIGSSNQTTVTILNDDSK